MKQLKQRANNLASKLRWKERGKAPFVRRLLEQALGQPCKYCGTEITLKNASLDHKTPFLSTAARKDLEERYRLDVPENLQIVCRRCNGAKGDLSDAQYRKLLKFLSKDEHMKKSVLKKLSQSYSIYAR